MKILGEAQTKQFSGEEDIEKFVEFAIPILEEEEKRIRKINGLTIKILAKDESMCFHD